MSIDALKQQIKAALDKGKDATQTLDSAADTSAIRKETADDIAAAVQAYVKASLTKVISGGVPVPQDGGAGLKSTMTAQINAI